MKASVPHESFVRGNGGEVSLSCVDLIKKFLKHLLGGVGTPDCFGRAFRKNDDEKNIL